MKEFIKPHDTKLHLKCTQDTYACFVTTLKKHVETPSDWGLVCGLGVGGNFKTEVQELNIKEVEIAQLFLPERIK